MLKRSLRFQLIIMWKEIMFWLGPVGPGGWRSGLLLCTRYSNFSIHHWAWHLDCTCTVHVYNLAEGSDLLVQWNLNHYYDEAYGKCKDFWTRSPRSMATAIGLAWVEIQEWAKAVEENPHAEMELCHDEPTSREDMATCV